MINPIFVDENVGASSYQHLRKDELLVTKIFPTIQGEGPFAGERAIFLRLAGCNYGGKGVNGIGCDFCDTNFKFSNGKALTFDEIKDELDYHWDSFETKREGSRLVVITGGEPMLQNNLINFVNYVKGDYFFQIETNGTRYLRLNSVRVTVVVSPKIPVGGNHPLGRMSYPPLKEIIMQEAFCLKLIVNADKNDPYHQIPKYVDNFMRRDKTVYVSPMTIYKKPPEVIGSIWDEDVIDIAATARNHCYAAELAMKYGFKVSLQTHLYLGVQ